MANVKIKHDEEDVKEIKGADVPEEVVEKKPKANTKVKAKVVDNETITFLMPDNTNMIRVGKYVDPVWVPKDRKLVVDVTNKALLTAVSLAGGRTI